MEETIDHDAVIRQLQTENEQLRRKLATRYLSMPPLVDEIRWYIKRVIASLERMSPEKLLLVSVLVSFALDMLKQVIAIFLPVSQREENR